MGFGIEFAIHYQQGTLGLCFDNQIFWNVDEKNLKSCDNVYPCRMDLPDGQESTLTCGNNMKGLVH